MRRLINNMKMLWKLMLGPMVVLFFLLVLSAIAYISLGQQHDTIEDFYRARFSAYLDSARIDQEITMVQGDLYKLLAWGSVGYNADKSQKLVQGQSAAIDTALGIIKKNMASGILTEEENQLYQKAVTQLDEYRKSVKDGADLVDTDANVATMMISSMAEEKYQALHKTISDLVALEQKLGEQRYEEAIRQFNTATRIFLLVLTGAVLLTVIVNVLLGQLIVSPVKTTVHAIRCFAAGDLTQQISNVSHDEVGDIAGALNSMAKNIAGLIREIAKGVENLTSSSTDMSDIACHMSMGAETTAEKSTAVAAAAEEMTINMNSVAASMEEAATNMSTIAASTEEMTTTIADIAQNAARAKESASCAVARSKKASQQVNELGSAAAEIGAVTETIRAISDKTNLLALNATIEAARAGEAGKGFAVVASEIKGLAQQTATATGDIAFKLKNIQKSTDATVTEIKEVSLAIGTVDDLVGSIAASVEEQNITTSGIAANISQAGIGISKINENVNQGSLVSAKVAQEISEVNAEAGEMSNSSAQVQQSAVELTALAEHLKTVVGRFRV